MKDERRLIADTLARLLTDQCPATVVEAAEAGDWPESLWRSLTETGLTLAGIKADLGGGGGEPRDSLLVMREAAKFAAPLPLAEHFMAAYLLQQTGQALPAACATVAVGDFRLEGSAVTGEAAEVPFARCCSHVLLLASSPSGSQLCLVPRQALEVEQRNNLAGEARDKVKAAGAKAEQLVQAPQEVQGQIRLLGAATRTVMMSGALEAVLELAVEYALERKQFGRAIAKFQAIQQQLAILAGEVAAATMAAQSVEAAFAALDEVEIAIGKSRVGEAVAQATDIAHQVHGAMGYTREHPLNQLTRRLWAWRDEYGAEPYWQQLVGRALTEGGADQLWQKVTARS